MSNQRSNKANLSRRDAVLDAICQILVDQKRRVIDLDTVLDESHVPVADIDAEFENSDDLLVALVERFAAALSRPLLPGPSNDGNEFADIRGKLTDFSTGLHDAYASLLVGFCRLAMTEGSRHKAVRKRVFEKGAGAVTASLTSFLQRAQSAGKVRIDNCSLAAEQLMGMLREPLYQELTLHSRELIYHKAPDDAVPAVVEMFLHGCGGRGEKA